MKTGKINNEEGFKNTYITEEAQSRQSVEPEANGGCPGQSKTLSDEEETNNRTALNNVRGKRKRKKKRKSSNIRPI